MGRRIRWLGVIMVACLGLVIAQLNRQMPYTCGDSVLPVDHVDVKFIDNLTRFVEVGLCKGHPAHL